MAAAEGRVPAPTIEVRSIDWVPEDERHGKVWQQGPFWFLGNFQFFTIAIGFIGPAVGLSVFWTFVAGAAGILFGSIFMALHATQGPNLGLPQMIQSRAQFGHRGVIVPLFATLFTFVAFNVVDQMLLAAGLHGIWGWNATLAAIGLAILAAGLAILGHDWIHKAFRLILFIAAPFFVVLTIGILTGKAGGAQAAGLGYSFVGFMTMFTAGASYNITYAPYVSDYTRYMPRNTSRWRIIWSVYLGAAGSPIWLIPIGAWLAAHLGAVDGLVALRDAGNSIVGGLGTIAAIMTVLALTATMGLNAYCGMLTVVTGIDSVRKIEPTRSIRIVWILVLGLVWLVIGLALSDKYVTALSNTLILMLYLLVPWTAVNLVDYFLVRHGNYSVTDLFTPKGIYGAWNGQGLITYFVTLAVMTPFAVLVASPGGNSPYTGFLASKLHGVDISAEVGLVVAGVVYFVLSRGRDLSAERAAIERSEHELGLSSHVDAGSAIRA
jgi:purine-cytosine permease-like protein